MGRIIAIDYGLKRIGIAQTDLSKILASPRGVVTGSPKHAEAIQNILAELKDETVEEFVVGLPLLFSGKDSDQTRLVREFASELERASGIPTKLWDERLTSKEVERAMIEGKVKRKKRTEHVDTLSATLILQSFLQRI